MITFVAFGLAVASQGGAEACTIVPPNDGHASIVLSALEAHEEGARLQRLGRHLESLPYFQRAVEVSPNSWVFHRDLGAALHNSSIEMSNDFGFVEYRVPSSLDRVRLAIRAIRSLEPDRYEGRPRKTRSGIPRVSRSRARSLWYGRSGFLPLAARFEESATDRNDDPIGTLIAEEDEVLVGLSLNDGRFVRH